MEELELTYLAKELPPDVLSAPHDEVLDVYIPSSSPHPHLRIRKCGNAYEITKKQPIEEGDASRQLETTILLTAEEFSELSMLEGKRVKKIRYIYDYNGTRYEVDVFQEVLKGLVLIDVEFKTIEAKNAFIPPPFCLADVTQEEFIAGGMLCGKTYQDIEIQLAEFGYTPIYE